MMLAHPQLDAVFDFSKDRVQTLVIEEPSFFRQFLQDIHMQIRGFNGNAVLSKDNMPIEFSKYADLIEGYLSFEISRKALISKLLSRMETIALDETHYVQTSQWIGELEQYLQELSFDLPCDVFCSKISISSILRAAGLEIVDDYSNNLERILDYMELTRELERDRLFIFVNLRSYYADEDVIAFFESILQHEFHVLMVDSVSKPVLAIESRVTVDLDLCEF